MIVWRLVLLLTSLFTVGVHSQLDSNGFLSISCGHPANTTFVDKETSLTYVSDAQFIDTGYAANMTSYVSKHLQEELSTLRYFPFDEFGARNCYTVRSVTTGMKYLIRATFLYGNYDNKDEPPIFHIYLGVNFWSTINATKYFSYTEIITVAYTDNLQVCLVHNNSGNPFINSIHVRRLKISMYERQVNSSQSLVSVVRYNLGESQKDLLRYPDDIHDRWWLSFIDKTWAEISTSSTVDLDSYTEAPALVMQSAVISSSTGAPLYMNWTGDSKIKSYYVILHFAEIQDKLGNNSREFNISAQGYPLYDIYSPKLLVSDYRGYYDVSVTDYSFSLVATSKSTLPPLLNAIEIYIVATMSMQLTYGADVSAINYIKAEYKIKNGWSGDPCLPILFRWNGITCSSNYSDLASITGLNLSSSKLVGPFSEYFGNLKGLTSLDLSGNDLSGNLSSLDKLTALTFLDITGNSRISPVLPPALQKKQKDGSLTYRFGGTNPIASNPRNTKKNVTIGIAVAASLILILVAIAIYLALKRRKYNQSIMPKSSQSNESISVRDDYIRNYPDVPQSFNPRGIPQSKGAEQIFPKFENRKFSYTEIKKITNNFKNNIGIGGYGSVYLGYLENGVPVAVKILSHSSPQGVKEFLAEAENLARVHHKNLVSLMGYCTENNSMALVYEYMEKGNLHDLLKDKETPLSWKQRVQIAYESALGLEYLHMACNPPLIHRDVKTSNILINANLEAKIADFGLSRAFENDAVCHVSTRIVGTIGYLDPECYFSNQLSTKSDVFSFGVVLLEIITGRTPTDMSIGGNLVQWVRHMLSGGDIESIVDPIIHDKYDINSVWKVADLAYRCTEPTSPNRPSMSAVVIELKESLNLEMSMAEIHIEKTENSPSDVNQNSTFEMAYMGGMPMIGPNVR